MRIRFSDPKVLLGAGALGLLALWSLSGVTEALLVNPGPAPGDVPAGPLPGGRRPSSRAICRTTFFE
jgi:hypothetical protein